MVTVVRIDSAAGNITAPDRPDRRTRWRRRSGPDVLGRPGDDRSEMSHQVIALDAGGGFRQTDR